MPSVSNNELKQQLDSFISRIDSNHGELTKKMDDVSSRLDVFERRITSLEERSLNTNNSVGELKASLDNSNERNR